MDVTSGNMFNIRGAIHDGHRVEAGDSFTGGVGAGNPPVPCILGKLSLYLQIFTVIHSTYIVFYILMYICIFAFATSNNWKPRV